MPLLYLPIPTYVFPALYLFSCILFQFFPVMCTHAKIVQILASKD